MKRFTKEEDEFIAKNYPLYGVKYCANALNRSSGGINYRRNYLNLENLTQDQFCKILSGVSKRRNPNEENVPREAFINPSTPEIAYVLGLIWADGYVKKGEKIVITGVTEDLKDDVECILKTGNWKIQEKKRKRYEIPGKNILRITTSNVRLTEYLESKNYKSKSFSSACSILETIPLNFQKYWFRGLFNGDGSVSVVLRPNRRPSIRISVASSYDQDWTYLENLCKKMSIKYGVYRRIVNRKDGKINKSSSFCIQNYNGCQLFLNYIFENEDNKIGLNRKYKKWQEYNIIFNEYLNTSKVKKQD